MNWVLLLPLLLGAPAHDWPAQGYGMPWQYAQVRTSALDGGTWHYDWSPNCPETQHIPMVWDDGAWRNEYLEKCNDGRPVLIGNEPESCLNGQACMSPERVAALLWRLSQWWEGEVWCCGTDVTALDYALRVVDAYRQRYGAWPATGWHVHAYANGTLRQPVTAAEFRSLNEAWRAEAALRQVDAFAEAMRPRGVLGRGMILSEYGALSADYWHGPSDFVAQMQAWREGISRRPLLVSAVWFAGYDEQFSSTNLLDEAGGLTALGEEWRR